MRPSRRLLKASPRVRALALAALAAVGFGIACYALGAWQRLESDTIDMRFAVRGAQSAPPEVVVVAIDDRTFSQLRLQWPFSRALHAEVIERLHADRARVIAYDIQFTEPGRSEREDLALYRAIGRAGNLVLATTEVNARGESAVLGGEANLRAAHARAAASNLPAEAGGIIRRYPYSVLGLPSFAVAAVAAYGRPIARTDFQRPGALIDYRGGPGAIRTVSFADVLDGRIAPSFFAGKVVVVGASAATLQDLHPTPTASTSPMSGPELQANAIWTALHGNPLQPARVLFALLAILICGSVAPLASLWLRPLRAALAALLVLAVYLLLAQLAFASGMVLVVSYPLAAWAAGMLGMLAGNYLGAFIERNAFARSLRESHLELIHRLASAVESRDAETGEHVHRIGRVCEQLALAIGWDAERAEMLRHASVMHDIGKIGIPDRILLKEGPLDAEEWEVVRSHTTNGADILAGSANPLVQMAEEIARCHHERWDGSGYPAGLRGEEIPLSARICAVVDVYDALLSKRSYKDAWQLDDVISELRVGRGAHFDPQLVDTFLEILPQMSSDLRSSRSTTRPTGEFQRLAGLAGGWGAPIG